MNAKKLVKVGLLTVGLTLAMSAAAFAATDTQGHWAKDVADKWERMGLIYGYPDGTMRLDQDVTRAEIGAMIKRIGQYPNASAVPGFTDVSASDWFYGDVATMVEQGIMSGYDAVTFGAGDPVTREQMGVMEAKIKNLPANEARAYEFNDGDVISVWARGSVGAVAEAGYMIGDTNNNFNGLKALTRGEAISTLDRLYAIEDAPQGGEPTEPTEPTEPATPAAQGDLSVKLSSANGTVSKNAVRTVTFEVSDPNATITAVSSDESIATVEVKDGKIEITGVKNGEATITVTVTTEDGQTATATYVAKVQNISISSGGGGGGGSSTTRYTIVLPAGTMIKVDGLADGSVIDFKLAKDLENTTELNTNYDLTVSQLMAAVADDSEAYTKLKKAEEVKGGGYVLISGQVKAVSGAKVTDATWEAKDGMTVVNADELKDALQVK